MNLGKKMSFINIKKIEGDRAFRWHWCFILFYYEKTNRYASMNNII